jgi:hypothetical protein
MNLLSPRHVVQHDDINASKHAQSVMWPECSNDHKGSELCIIANRHPLTTPQSAQQLNTEVKERNIYTLNIYIYIKCIYIYIYIRVCKTRTSRRFSPSKSYENDFERCFKIFDSTRRGKLCDTCKGACILFVTLHSRTF